MIQTQVSAQVVVSKQVYQLPGGQRQEIVSVTEEPGAFDAVLVLQPEGGGSQTVQMLSEFAVLHPELVH